MNDIISSLKPHITSGEKSNFYLKSAPKISTVVSDIVPKVQLVSNDSGHCESGSETEKSSKPGSCTSHDSSIDDLGEVLNSIENKLGLAAIENGQYQDGLNLLRYIIIYTLIITTIKFTARHRPPLIHTIYKYTKATNKKYRTCRLSSFPMDNIEVIFLMFLLKSDSSLSPKNIIVTINILKSILYPVFYMIVK